MIDNIESHNEAYYLTRKQILSDETVLQLFDCRSALAISDVMTWHFTFGYPYKDHKYKGIEKAENCTIDSALLNSGKITFTGTDNGLVSMSDAVNFSMEKFKFHLELYNKFAVLLEGNDTHYILGIL